MIDFEDERNCLSLLYMLEWLEGRQKFGRGKRDIYPTLSNQSYGHTLRLE